MKPRPLHLRHAALLISVCLAPSLFAQAPAAPPWNEGGPPLADGFPPPSGPGGPGGMMPQELKVVSQFDKDGNERLNNEERKAAREFIAKQRINRGPGPGGRRGGFGGPNENQTPAQPGAKLSPADVKVFTHAPLYDELTLRTLFFEFENADWEKELADFHETDVDVPAKLTVDGQAYPMVGVHFRGMSSFMMVGEGRKRSLNVSLDFADEKQQLNGYRTLNLLNSHEDPTFLRTVLYSHIAREYVPTPKANFVRVVINGESWGVYVSVEQFNKDFVKARFGTTKGARWKVTGSPNGHGGLEYLGDDAAPYKRIYDLKSKDDPASWAALIKLCKVLNQTATNELEAALAPLLDVDGALKFLALENALINNDGYWVRASDYSLYLDVQGKFHIIPHDMNETFSLPGGPGFGRGPGSRGSGVRSPGVELDPLVAANDTGKPLLSKLLAVPALRTRYLGYVHEMAEQWLDWNRLGPLVEQYQAVIAAEVKADTRKLDSTGAFFSGVTNTVSTASRPFRGPPSISLRNFVERRRVYLLERTGTAGGSP